MERKEEVKRNEEKRKEKKKMKGGGKKKGTKASNVIHLIHRTTKGKQCDTLISAGNI